MTKGLFTSSEEIKFQNAYVRGNIEKPREPNTMRNPAQTKCLCGKKQNRKIQKTFLGRTR